MRKVPVVTILVVFCCGPTFADDRTTYDEGSRPRILINWESFEEQGFPSEWKQPFTNVVINGYTRINRVLGIDVRPQFHGYTTKTDSDPGEIVISANEKHADSSRLASTFGFFPDRLKIVFHRKRGSDLTPWNWTPFWPNNGEYSMYAVFMHELGHCLGLDHSGPTKTIMGGYTWTSHHGPWSGDQADTRSLYRVRVANRLRQLATYDGGRSWSTLGNDITNFGGPWGRTTNRIAAAETLTIRVIWSAGPRRTTSSPGCEVTGFASILRTGSTTRSTPDRGTAATWSPITPATICGLSWTDATTTTGCA